MTSLTAAMTDDGIVYTIERSARATLCTRVAAVVVCGLASFGFYANYDVPGALATHLKERLQVDASHIGLLYSVSTIPSIALVVASGWIVDRFGLKTVSTACAALVVVGSSTFALGVARSSFATALVGRFLFGVGGDSVGVVCDSILCRYFSHKQLSFAIACVSTFLCLADVCAFALLPRAAAAHGVLAPLVGSVASCLVGFVAVVAFWCTVADVAHDDADAADDADEADAPIESVWATLRLFKVRFWVLVLLGGLLSAIATTFNGFSADILVERHGLDPVVASQRTSILSLANLAATPALGVLLSGVQSRFVGLWLTAACLVSFAAMLYMLYIPLDWSTWPSLFALGVSYAMIAAGVWPQLPLVSPHKHTGLSFGIAYSVSNLCVSLLYSLCGRVIAESPERMLRVWAFVAAAAAALALFWATTATTVPTVVHQKKRDH